MPQWRKLHVKITDSMDFNDMPDDFTRLTWCLLTLKVCKEGRGIDMPQWIKAQLFPLRSDITLEEVESAVRWYHERGMIERYTVNGRPYFEIASWHDYQSTDREANSPYPSPDNGQLIPRDYFGDVKEDLDQDLEKDKDIDKDASQMSNSRVARELLMTNSGYEQIRQRWLELFPEKPQPRSDNKTLQGKVKTRMKSAHFDENWEAALERASHSSFLHTSNFFDLGWFLQNDNHYEKCLCGNYDDRSPNGGKPSRAQMNIEAAEAVKNGLKRG